MPFNFWKRKPPATAPPTQPSADSELDHLRAELSKRQEQVAALQLEQFEFTRFTEEIAARLGPWQRRFAELEAQLAEAHLRSTRRALWGERADSPDVPDDVAQQYQRTWAQADSPPPPAQPAEPVVEPLEANKIKTLYRILAKRFHPDLAADPEEKAARAARMAQVNAAYAARDWAKLQAKANQPDQRWPAAAPPPKTRAEILAELRHEIERLDDVIAELEKTLAHETDSAVVELKLEADLARWAGRDLLTEMEADLQAEVARVEAELAALG